MRPREHEHAAPKPGCRCDIIGDSAEEPAKAEENERISDCSAVIVQGREYFPGRLRAYETMPTGRRDEMAEELNELQQDVLSQAKMTTRALGLGCAVALAVVIAKLTGEQQTLDLKAVKLPGRYGWAVLAALTVAHVFLAIFLVRAIHMTWREQQSPTQGRSVFKAVKKEGGFFVTLLAPRVKRRGKVYVMDMADPTTYYAHFGVLLLVAATLPWYIDDGLRWETDSLWSLAVMATLLGTFNWLAGGTWIVALSELTLDKEEAAYHKRLELTFHWPEAEAADGAPPPQN